MSIFICVSHAIAMLLCVFLHDKRTLLLIPQGILISEVTLFAPKVCCVFFRAHLFKSSRALMCVLRGFCGRGEHACVSQCLCFLGGGQDASTCAVLRAHVSLKTRLVRFVYLGVCFSTNFAVCASDGL